MKSLVGVAAGLFVLVLPFLANAQDAELEKFQGTWDLVSLNLNGKEFSPDKIRAAQLQTIYKGNTLSRVGGGDERDSATIKIDSSKTPSHLDTTNNDGVTELGIYKFEGDSLTICTRTESDKARPTKFAPNADKTVLTVWKRVKR